MLELEQEVSKYSSMEEIRHKTIEQLKDENETLRKSLKVTLKLVISLTVNFLRLAASCCFFMLLALCSFLLRHFFLQVRGVAA